MKNPKLNKREPKQKKQQIRVVAKGFFFRLGKKHPMVSSRWIFIIISRLGFGEVHSHHSTRMGQPTWPAVDAWPS